MSGFQTLSVFLTFVGLATGCATSRKASSVTTLNSKKEQAVAAIVLTYESLKNETEALSIIGKKENFEIETTAPASLEIPGAKIFLIELPPDDYRVDGFAFGGRFYSYGAFNSAPPAFQTEPGKITVLPAVNLTKSGHHEVVLQSEGLDLVNSEAAERVKKSFPDRPLILGFKK